MACSTPPPPTSSSFLDSRIQAENTTVNHETCPQFATMACDAAFEYVCCRPMGSEDHNGAVWDIVMKHPANPGPGS